MDILKKNNEKVDFDSLLIQYNPKNQATICGNREKCIFGDYPTLSMINDDYGTKASEMWLVVQLYDLSEFCGVKEKLSKEQLTELANLIAEDYSDMKISELMMFFRKIKKGEYGRFYGNVDPLVIMIALRHFNEEINEIIHRRRRKIALEKLEIGKRNAVTWEEYRKIKNNL